MWIVGPRKTIQVTFLLNRRFWAQLTSGSTRKYKKYPIFTSAREITVTPPTPNLKKLMQIERFFFTIANERIEQAPLIVLHLTYEH